MLSIPFYRNPNVLKRKVEGILSPMKLPTRDIHSVPVFNLETVWANLHNSLPGGHKVHLLKRSMFMPPGTAVRVNDGIPHVDATGLGLLRSKKHKGVTNDIVTDTSKDISKGILSRFW
jgi:hypothetical protein